MARCAAIMSLAALLACGAAAAAAPAAPPAPTPPSLAPKTPLPGQTPTQAAVPTALPELGEVLEAVDRVTSEEDVAGDWSAPVKLAVVFKKDRQVQQRTDINRRSRANLLVIVDGRFFIAG